MHLRVCFWHQVMEPEVFDTALATKTAKEEWIREAEYVERVGEIVLTHKRFHAAMCLPSHFASPHTHHHITSRI